MDGEEIRAPADVIELMEPSEALDSFFAAGAAAVVDVLGLDPHPGGSSAFGNDITSPPLLRGG
jgi:hypothetical protein